MRAVPWQSCRAGSTFDCREGRLQRIDMAQPLRGFELPDIMVRESDRAHFSLSPQLEQRAPVVLDRCAVLRRPMHLLEIDSLHLQPAETVLNLPTTAPSGADLPRQGFRVSDVPDPSTFREDA